MNRRLPEARAIVPHKPLADLTAVQLRTLVALLLQELLAMPRYVVGKTRLIVAQREFDLLVTETVDAYEVESCETFGEAKPVSDQFPAIEGATDLGQGM